MFQPRRRAGDRILRRGVVTRPVSAWANARDSVRIRLPYPEPPGRSSFLESRRRGDMRRGDIMNRKLLAGLAAVGLLAAGGRATASAACGPSATGAGRSPNAWRAFKGSGRGPL